MNDEQRHAVITARVTLELAFYDQYHGQDLERPYVYMRAAGLQDAYDELMSAFPEMFGPQNYFENDLLHLGEGC